MSIRRGATAACTLLIALTAAGCGATSDSAGSFSGDAKPVAQVIDDLQKAGSRHDASKICSEILAQNLVRRIQAQSKRTCAATLKDSLRDVDSFDLKVVKNGITVTGATAAARVKSKSGKDDRIDTLQLVKEPRTTGGKTIQVWKVSSLG